MECRCPRTAPILAPWPERPRPITWRCYVGRGPRPTAPCGTGTTTGWRRPGRWTAGRSPWPGCSTTSSSISPAISGRSPNSPASAVGFRAAEVCAKRGGSSSRDDVLPPRTAVCRRRRRSVVQVRRLVANGGGSSSRDDVLPPWTTACRQWRRSVVEVRRFVVNGGGSSSRDDVLPPRATVCRQWRRSVVEGQRFVAKGGSSSSRDDRPSPAAVTQCHSSTDQRKQEAYVIGAIEIGVLWRACALPSAVSSRHHA